MSTLERLQTMERLWDVLCHELEEPESPSWHADVLAHRRERINSGQGRFFSLEEVREQLRR